MIINQDHLARVYSVTNDGLDIIKDVCPQAANTVNNRRNFKLRPEERTPSAHLYPPGRGCDYWHVVDYGGSEDERRFSPIDLYMLSKGYTQEQFSMALHELMEMYGVTEDLNSKVNKPILERHAATEAERAQGTQVTFKDGFTTDEVTVWGPLVKAEHLTELGWKAVEKVSMVKGDEVLVKTATPTFPIFAQECHYQDEQGNLRSFLKLYEPLNPNKAYRFSIVGEKPRRYLFGLSALRRKFEQRGDEKLDEVVLVSGGSDAVNCLSMGFQPVWMGSETEELSTEDFHLLLKYAKRVVNIPDIDATGRRMGQRLALRILGIYTAWLKPEDMGYLHDNRGRQRKDLKDYLQLHPQKQALRKLVNRAKCAQFWTCSEDKNHPGLLQYNILRARLDYFLELNGFYTLADTERTEPMYVRIKDHIVSRVKAKNITDFLNKWMEGEGLDEHLRNRVLRSHDLPNNQSTTLAARNDLDFTNATPTEQRFFFRNGWVSVTAEDCTFHRYQELTDCYVWEENIIPHDYRPIPKMFTVQQDDDGGYTVLFDNMPASKLMQFIVNSSRLYWRKLDEGGQELTDAESAEEHQCMVTKLAAMGYLVHSYKSESAAWAALCMDSTLGETDDECNGRSGKSFFLKATGQFLNPCIIDSRNRNVLDNRFLFDGVTAATKLIIFDECHQKFQFDSCFGYITGDLRYEEKGNHPQVLTFKESPKIAFATNYVITRHDPSMMARLWPVVFSDYYHVATSNNTYRESRSIRDDFGCNLMGTDYPEAEWQNDIAFILQCCQFYLSLPADQRRIMPPMDRIELREKNAVVGKDFKLWADIQLEEGSEFLDQPVKCEILLNSFNAETHYMWSLAKFTRHLKAYCDMADHLQCLNPTSITGRKKDGEAWAKRENGKQIRYYYIQTKPKQPAPPAEDASEAEEEQLLF